MNTCHLKFTLKIIQIFQIDSLKTDAWYLFTVVQDKLLWLILWHFRGIIWNHLNMHLACSRWVNGKQYLLIQCWLVYRYFVQNEQNLNWCRILYACQPSVRAYASMRIINTYYTMFLPACIVVCLWHMFSVLCATCSITNHSKHRWWPYNNT